MSHELRLVAFVPTSLPWVFFSLVVGHLDLIGNQSRWYMCVGLIPIWSTYWDFFYPAACVNGWKIIFLLYSSGSKFTITSLLSKWVYLNYFLDVFKKAQPLGRFTAVFLTFALSSLLHVSKRRIIHVPVWVSTIKNNLSNSNGSLCTFPELII